MDSHSPLEIRMTTHRSAWTWMALGVLAAMAMLLAPARGAETRVERWYGVELLGQRSGWSRNVRTTTEATITSESEMLLQIKRGAVEIRVKVNTEFVETLEGKAVSMTSSMEMGSPAVEQKYVFKEDGVERTITSKGKATTAMLPKIEGEWLTPAAAERYVAQRLKAKPKAITLKTIDPTSGEKLVSITHSEFTSEAIKAMGRDIEATKTTIESSIMPGTKVYEWYDAEETLVKQETSIGALRLTMTITTKTDALGESDAPELMISMFVRPEGEIEQPRRTKRAAYLLSVAEGAIGALPNTGSQRVETVDEWRARVKVDAAFPHAAPEGDATNAVYLASTALADLSDGKVQELREKALTNAGEGGKARAEALRRYVHTFIKKKTLGVGYATASDVARSREGDCSEHGVLLAALLRAEGIPSRVVSGLIFADAFAGEEKIFGYHMWAQALLEVKGVKTWVDLDATLPNATPYDATHIALVTSDLADGQTAVQLAAMAPLLGRLKIKVEKVE